MTEHEWLTSDDPAAMLRHLTHRQESPVIITGYEPYTIEVRRKTPLISERQLVMFISACCRQVGMVEELVMKYEQNPAIPYELARSWRTDMSHRELTAEIKAHLLREIVGNPFKRKKYYHVNGVLCEESPAGNIPDDVQPVLWLSPTVHDLAQAIYDGELGCNNCSYWLKYGSKCRSCGTSKEMKGQFQSHLMPILGDALEEAGCTDEDVLRHCRGEERCVWASDDVKIDHGGKDWTEMACRCNGTGWMPLRGPHVRGCWVVDLILGHE